MKRAAIAAVVAVAVLVAGAGGYFFWFISSLNGVLGQGADSDAAGALSEREDFDQPFYMLMTASDTRTAEHDTDVDQRTDVMLLVRVDAKNRQITMLSIPRDTPYVLDDGTVTKMNELYNIGGMKAAIEGVSKLTGVAISHYCMVYVSDCASVVDELGGIDVDVPYDIDYTDRITGERTVIQSGVQHLDGHQAQVYATSRHDAVDMGEDAYRQLKVRMLVEAIATEVLGRPVYEIPSLVVRLASYVQVDMQAEELVDLALDFASGSGSMTVYRASGPSEGALDEETGMWLCYDDPEGWAKVVAVTDSGGDPSTVVYDSDSQ